MALDPAFIADSFYTPEGLLFDTILEVDHENSRVVARMATHSNLPLTNTQRVDPQRHPAHVNGGLMVHLTGMVAYAHFYYVFGLRHADGWVGFGARIHNARFVALAPPGVPLDLECRCTQNRQSETRILARYDFRFMQAGNLVYRSDQSALWMKTDNDLNSV